MLLPLVKTPAINVPPAACVTAPARVEISATPAVPTVFKPASVKDDLLAIFRPLAVNPVSVPI